MSENTPLPIVEEDDWYRDHLATVDEHGKRVWIYPKKPKGKFTNYRPLFR